MIVASQDLCMKLYELSNWDDTEKQYCKNSSGGYNVLLVPQDSATRPFNISAYDLGYLLRKLPSKRVKLRNTATGWYCQYQKDGGGPLMVESNTAGKHIIHRREWIEFGETPEDAACRLAIALVEDGILNGGGRG